LVEAYVLNHTPREFNFGSHRQEIVREAQAQAKKRIETALLNKNKMKHY
jgi:hypothetical protein